MNAATKGINPTFFNFWTIISNKCWYYKETLTRDFWLCQAVAQQDDDLHRAVAVLPAVDGASLLPHGLQQPHRGTQ